MTSSTRSATCSTPSRRPPSNPALAARGLTSYRELKTFVPDRPGHDRRYAIDAAKIGRDLGWQAVHDLGSGLERTVRWYLANPWWCEEVQQGRYGRERLGLGQASGPAQGQGLGS